MKDRRRIAVIGMALSMGMMMAGCAGAVKNEPQTEVKELELTDEKQDAHLLEDTEKETGQEDGMILAQTTVSDEDGMVTLLDVKDAKKIPVKFTADTKVEHWTIQGGGAGIDMQEVSFSDLEEGQGVEVEGNFEGETFVATRVIIEVYE